MEEPSREPVSGRILVVDDDPAIRTLLVRMLVRDGYSIEEASSGPQALAVCSQFHPHLLLLDILLPGMSGFQVCAQLQALPDAQRPTVLMITSLADQESIDRAFAVGAADHITKPIHLPLLRRRVQRLVKARQAEEALLNARDELEERIQRRTAELERANRELQQEVIARQQAEAQQRVLSAGLRAVVATADELIAAPDMDTLYRRAVELAREKLGVERCGLFLEGGGVLCGTYGTDRQRRTTDEHAATLAKDRDLEREFREMAPEDSYSILENVPFTEWEGDQLLKYGEGWVGFTPIKSGTRVIGAFFNDTAITGAAVDPATQARLGVFCSLLGNIIERKQAEQALRQAHDELEKHVVERTEQLSEAVRQLYAEIAERSRAEIALEDERNMLRTLIDNLPDYIFVKDLEGRFVISNLAHSQAAEHAQDVVGKTALDTFPEELAAQFQTDDQTVIHTGEPLINGERRTVDAVGNVRWVLTTKAPIRDRQGRISGLVGISRDITDRKQMEETLRESEERFRSAFDNAPIGMSLETPDGRYLMVNKALCEIVGYTEGELLSKNFLEITHPDDVPTDTDKLHKMASGEKRSWQFQKRYIHKTGRVVWVDLNVFLVRSWQGDPLYLIVQVQDITERNQMEETLRDSEERFRKAFDGAPIGMALVGPDGRWLKVNAALCEIVGYSEDELLTTTFQDITHSDDLETDLHYVRQMLSGAIRTSEGERQRLLEELRAPPRRAPSRSRARDRRRARACS